MYPHLLAEYRRHFTRNVLRSKFAKWHNRCASERKLNPLVSRAVQFNHMRIMFRAFDNWRNLASEEAGKLATAERHMLRFRYFNGWKGVTVVQQLKIQRFQKGKFFALWWQERTKLRALEVAARSTDRSNLLHNAFRLWLMHYCDRRAPLWKAENRIRKVFTIWLDQMKLQKAREDYVETTLRPHTLERKQLVHWCAQRQLLLRLETEAHSFRKRSLLHSSIKDWHQTTILTPKASLFTAARTSRATRKMITLWRSRTKLSRNATTFHDIHVLQRAFTMWNHALRCYYVIEDINIRIQAEALYRWSLASRMSQANRNLEMKALTTSFLHWRKRTTEQRTTLDGLVESYSGTKRHLQMLSSLRRWYSGLHKHQQDEESSAAFRRKSLTDGSLRKWRVHTRHIYHLDEQASAARFYISTKAVLKTWRETTHEHQRLRRREAFAVVRRNGKVRLARGMLQRLSNAVVNIHAMDRITSEKAEDKAWQSVFASFASWKARSHSLQTQTAQALHRSAHKVLVSGMQTWTRSLHNIHRCDEAAVSFHAAAVEKEASNYFRQLDRRLFQIRGHDHLASQLRVRHWQKHVKSMLRYWSDRAAALKDGRAKQMDVPGHAEDDQVDDDDLQGAGPAVGHTVSLRHQRVMLEGSVFDPHDPHPDRFGAGGDAIGGELAFEGKTVLTSTPLPGYLRTPSRRVGRAKAREKLVNRDSTSFSTRTPGTGFAEVQTTATAPPAYSAFPLSQAGLGTITPFERKLRAGGYPGYKHHKANARSDLIGRPSTAVDDPRARLGDFDNIGEGVEPQSSSER